MLRSHKGHSNLKRLHTLSHKVMSALDVLGPCMVLGIVGQVLRSTIINSHGCRFTDGLTELRQEISQVDGLFCPLRSSHDLRFARGDEDSAIVGCFREPHEIAAEQ